MFQGNKQSNSCYCLEFPTTKTTTIELMYILPIYRLIQNYICLAVQNITQFNQINC